MSDNQIPTDELEYTPSVEDENPSVEDAPRLPDELEIGGRAFRREEVEDVLENFGTWREMQAAHTRRSQAVADERRELERLREEMSMKTEQVANERSSYGDDDSDDLVNRLLQGQSEIQKRLDAQEQRYNQSMAEVQRENEMEGAMDKLRGKPNFDEREVRDYMETYNLGPSQAGVAYQAVAGYRVGQEYGEKMAASRYRAPVMGSTPGGVSPGFTSPQEAVPQRPKVGDTSWEDFERMAVDDDGIG